MVTVGAHERPRRTWAATTYALSSAPVAATADAAVVACVSLSVGLLVFVIGFPLLARSLTLASYVAAFERARVEALLGERIPDPHDRRGAGSGASLADGAAWREVAHAFASLAVAPLAAAIVLAVWIGGLAIATLPAYAWALPGHLGDSVRDLPAGVVAGSPIIGTVLLLLAPRVVAAITWVQRRMAVALLGPSRRRVLQARVDHLSETRDRSVDAAAAERQRIERDLHDGAQQRLVALAMDLGVAKTKLDSDPATARGLVAQAHEEAKRALEELRNLARGIHPPVLIDGGLDAALSALAARSAVPVAVDVGLTERPPSRLETVAYFVVAEALTNVARHAQAQSASVRVWQQRERLVIEVVDDGIGGADANLGSGLAGLTDRVASVDGDLIVTSPRGGPTTIRAELPCGS